MDGPFGCIGLFLWSKSLDQIVEIKFLVILNNINPWALKG